MRINPLSFKKSTDDITVFYRMLYFFDEQRKKESFFFLLCMAINAAADNLVNVCFQVSRIHLLHHAPEFLTINLAGGSERELF